MLAESIPQPQKNEAKKKIPRSEICVPDVIRMCKTTIVPKSKLATCKGSDYTKTIANKRCAK